MRSLIDQAEARPVERALHAELPRLLQVTP